MKIMIGFILILLACLVPGGFIILILLALLLLGGKFFGGVVEGVSDAVSYSNNPQIRKALDEASKMSNSELAKAIREADNYEVERALKKVFFARGNTKKDIYNF